MLKTVLHALTPGSDAVFFLKDEHRNIQALFKKYLEAQDKRGKTALGHAICTELDMHTKIEEQVFYPAIKLGISDARASVNVSLVEHATAKRMTREIQRLTASDELFAAKLKVLMDMVNHHIMEEDNVLFPQVIESSLDLRALGERLARAKGRLLAGARIPVELRKPPAMVARTQRTEAVQPQLGI